MKQIFKGIYKIINTKNSKAYIGSSINIEKRIKRHFYDLKSNKHKNIYLQREYNLYCPEDFIYDIIEYVNNDIDILLCEQKYLDQIFSDPGHFNHYYNIGRSSNGGDNISKNPNRDIIVKNLKIALTNRYLNQTLEEKERISNNRKGEKNHRYNTKWSDIRKENQSIRLKENYIGTNYISSKTWEEYHGIEKAEQMKKNLSSIDKSKEKNPFYGKKHNEDSKKKMSESKKGVINNLKDCKPFYINDKYYLSLRLASIDMDIKIPTICFRLKSENPRFETYRYATYI